MSMSKRQAYAFDHVLSRADDLTTMDGLRAQHQHQSGLLLRTILAVDR